MCIALTNNIPSAMPLSRQQVAASSVMRTSSRRFGVLKVKYLVCDFNLIFPQMNRVNSDW